MVSYDINRRVCVLHHALQGMRLIRFGGSFAKSIRWKDWRGPFWNRPSSRHIHHWSALGGWGFIESVAFADALDILPVFTLGGNPNSAQDLADLVEYCWGGNDTVWGSTRIRDGHPAVLNLTAFVSHVSSSLFFCRTTTSC